MPSEHTPGPVLGEERLARDQAGPYVEMWDGDGWMRSGRVHRLAAERIKELEAEVERAKQAHLGACETIAQMHAAATGEVAGPRRGVVEDVEDLRAQRDELLEALKVAAKALQLLGAPATSARAAIARATGEEK